MGQDETFSMFVETGPALFRFINISWGKKLGYV
jgi:hypothetical protein